MSEMTVHTDKEAVGAKMMSGAKQDPETDGSDESFTKDGAIRHLMERNNFLRRILVGFALFYVVLVGLTFAAAFIAAASNKEIAADQDSGLLVTTTGHGIKTEVVSRYATLLDLPKFGLEPLSKLETVQLQTASGSMFFKLSGYYAQSSTRLTLFTTAGGEVDIDVTGETATVTLASKAIIPLVVKKTAAARRRILSSGAGNPKDSQCLANGACLHTFQGIQELHRVDAGGRRLLEDAMGGVSYVSISTSSLMEDTSIQEMLEAQETQAPPDSQLLGNGVIDGVQVKYSMDLDGNITISFQHGDITTLFSPDRVFTFNRGALTKCEDGIDTKSNEDLKLIMLGNYTNFEFTVIEELRGVARSPSFMKAVPSVDECKVIYLSNIFESKQPQQFNNEASSGSTGYGSNKRRLLSVDEKARSRGYKNAAHQEMSHLLQIVDKLHADPDSNGRKLLENNVNVKASTARLFGEMAEDAYLDDFCENNRTVYGDWTCQGKLKEEETFDSKDNAYANFFTASNQRCAVVFRGTNDNDDWIANLIGMKDTPVDACGTGFKVESRLAHSGFVREFQALLPAIQAKAETIDGGCNSWHFSGHSLGGAMAAIADYCYNGTSIIFASPKTFVEKLNHVEYRLFHERDPVSGGGFGTMNNFQHNGGALMISRTCRWEKPAVRRCTNYTASAVGPQDGSGNVKTGVSTHMIGYVRSFA